MTDRSVRVKLSLSHNDFSRGLAVVAGQTAAFTKTLDTSNNRMSMLVQTGIALGPALVPVMGAVAAGGIGMAEALGATAVGAGVAVLAFQGVGDALKALNDYAIDPTAEHLQTLHEKLSVLGPDGKRFVLMLQDLRPELEKLQATAARGVLPGVTEGLDHLLAVQPQVENLISNIATALGSVAAEGGEALASPFWTDFLDFLATDGRDSMVTMLEIIGQLTKATASLVMAFDPLSQDIGGSLLEKTQELAKWADQLDETQGFADFTEWLERVGPKAWDTLGAIGEALVAVVKAAAPVGEITLPVLTALAEVITAIASSPVGPVLIGVAAGINAISRAVALSNAAGGSAITGFLFGKEGKSGITSMSRQAAAVRGVAAAIGILALSLTDLDESMGVTNAANFGLAGAAIGGPAGFGIGTLIGSLQDLKAANQDVSASFDDLGASMLSLDDVEFGRRVDDIQAKIDELGKKQFELQGAGGGLLGGLPFGAGGAFGGIFGSTDDEQAKLDKLIQTRAAILAAPPSTFGVGPLRSLSAGLNDALDSRRARAGGVGSAIAALDNQLVDTTTSAEDLSAALDALLNPTMDLEAATDAYTSALRHWEDELSKSNKTLEGNSDAAIKNRAAIRGRVDLLKQQLEAEANAGWGSDRLTKSMQRERQALLDAAKSAGLNRKEVRDLIATYGLTPKLIRTLIEANTDSAKRKILEIQRLINQLHGRNITIGVAFDRGIGPGQNIGPTGGGASGGQVRGWGGPTDDNVPIMASHREWIHPVSAVDYYGSDFMHAVQTRTLPRMAGGGPVSWFADGSRGSRMSIPYGLRTSVAGDARSGAMRISGRLTLDPDGTTGYIRGVVRDAMDGDSEFAASTARQRGS